MAATQMAQPVQGRRAVTATATPIAQVTASSGTPTYTSKRVTDSAVWDLSAVEVGHIVEAVDPVDSEIYTGVINAVENASNYVEVQGWIRGGASGQARAAMKPSDGSPAIIHKIDKCKVLLTDALDDNSATVYVGFDSSVTVDPGLNPGHPIARGATQGNHRLIVDIELGDLLNLMRVYVIGTVGDELSWIAM